MFSTLFFHFPSYKLSFCALPVLCTMSKSDIRSFFAVKSKSGVVPAEKNDPPKRKVISSDDEESENKRLNGSTSKAAVKKEVKV